MKISIKALFFGYLVYMACAGLSAMANLFLHTRSPDSFVVTMAVEQILSFVFLGINILIAVLVGYCTAKFAGKEEFLHGIAIGFIIWGVSFCFTYVYYTLYAGQQPAITLGTFTSFILIIFPCLLGAFIRKKINEKLQEKSTAPLEQKINDLGN